MNSEEFPLRELTEFTDLDLLLSATVSELQLSVRALNAYQNAELKFVGQLVQQRPEKFLRIQNFGRSSLKETEEVLSKIGLAFGSDVKNWDIHRARKIRAENVELIRARLAASFGAFASSYPSAIDELTAILTYLVEGRNREIVGRYWGLLGERPRTLESVGQEYAMTRERVRQIAAKAEKTAQSIWLPTENCSKLIKQLEELSPMPLPMAQEFVDKHQSPGHLPVESLINIAEVFNLPSQLEVMREGTTAFIDRRDRRPSIHEITMDFRRTTSRSGTISIDRTSLRLTGGLEARDTIQRVLAGLPETLWLDQENHWATSLNPERNRLANTLRKILTVAKAVHVSEMRQAALRSHRLPFVPPQNVLASFAEKICHFSVSDGLISRGDGFEPADLGEIEQTLFECFQQLGSPLPRERIESYCIDGQGMNDNSFYVYLSYSPIVIKVQSGIYGLVGAEVPIGTVEQLSASRKVEARSEYGWDKQGRLWFATRLSRLSIKMGMFYLPAFVVDLTAGDWAAFLPDGTNSGTIEVAAQGITGVRQILELSGAEPDDVMRLKFDFVNKSAQIEVGNEELFEDVSAPIGDVDLRALDSEEFEKEE